MLRSLIAGPRADTLFVAALSVGVLMLVACSGRHSAHPVTSVPVSNSDFKIDTLSKKPPVFQLALGSTSVFFNVVEECKLPAQWSLAATTRQLIAGMESVRPAGEEALTVAGSPALRSLFNARLDGRDIAVAVYALRRKDCVRDYTFWQNVQAKEDGFSDEQLAQLTRLVEQQAALP